jgi:small neutral amino acid transporter SnatA (MarC family)
MITGGSPTGFWSVLPKRTSQGHPFKGHRQAKTAILWRETERFSSSRVVILIFTIAAVSFIRCQPSLHQSPIWIKIIGDAVSMIPSRIAGPENLRLLAVSI